MRSSCCEDLAAAPLRALLLSMLLALSAGCGGGGSSTSAQTAGSFRTDQVLLSLADPDDEDEWDRIRERFAGLEFERIGGTSFFVLRLAPGQDLDAILRDLEDDVRVVSAERDYFGQAPEGGPSGSATIGSELIDAIAAQGALIPLELDLAHATSRGAGVVVAVVDTGVDPAHPLLLDRIAPGGYDFIGGDPDPSDERNGLDEDGDGLPDDQYGHGTFVATLVLAVAPDARILPVRVLDDEGVGTTSGVAAGIALAVDLGAQVINVSIDVPIRSDALRDAIDYARARGAVVVAAAGNGARDQILFPASLGDVVAVAAVDAAGVSAPFTNHDSDVDLAAPGVDLLGGVPLDLNPLGTARWSGTSFAAPLVAGSIALVAADRPGDRSDDWIDRLEQTARSLDAQNPALAGKLGKGLVQPAAALAR